MRQHIRFDLERLPAMDELAVEWAALEASSSGSVFTSWNWISTWLSTLPAEVAPHLIRASVGGLTVALGLLCSSENWYRRLIRSETVNLNVTGDSRYDCLAVEHNDLLSSGTAPAELNDMFLEWFATELGELDELYLPGITWPVSAAALKRYSLLEHAIETPYYYVDLKRVRVSAGDLIPQLSANSRQQLRRAIRHWERYGPLTVQEACTLQEAHEFFWAMKRLHIPSWERRGKPHAFINPYVEQFHLQLIDTAFHSGAIELLRISAGDFELGILYNLRHRDRTYSYQSGFIDDARGRPGYVSHCLAVKYASDRGMATYDFLAGSNRLKESLSTDHGMMRWVRLQRPRLRFRALQAARRIKERLIS